MDALAPLAPCLVVTLEDGRAHIEAAPDRHAFVGHLRADRSFDDFQRALEGRLPLPAETRPAADTLPLDALPPEMRALSDQIDPRQAQALFTRLTRGALKKAGNDRAGIDEARSLLRSAAPDWSSPGGRQITAVLECLTLPDGWREPEFAVLRDAYALHERRRRSTNADLYPGDAETMARVPDALDYTPVYAGRDG